VSDSVDLGYTVGEFVVAARDENGAQVRRSGKYCMVWKKQGDGSWKVILDIANGTAATVTEPQVEIV
jgi:ketosteroid isomerase-like protein